MVLIERSTVGRQSIDSRSQSDHSLLRNRVEVCVWHYGWAKQYSQPVWRTRIARVIALASFPVSCVLSWIPSPALFAPSLHMHHLADKVEVSICGTLCWELS